MPERAEKIIELRQLLADRFGSSPLPEEHRFSTGLPALDKIGIPQGALTEIVATPQRTTGAGLLFYGLVHTLLTQGQRVILIDGKDSFSPNALPPSNLSALLWIRCHQAAEALKAADLAIRDGNISVVIFFLIMNPVAETRRLPSTGWHRLQMLAEKSDATVFIFTPQPLVGCARLRLKTDGVFPLTKLHHSRQELTTEIKLAVERGYIRQERNADDENPCRSTCA